jgi:hypothetical protein
MSAASVAQLLENYNHAVAAAKAAETNRELAQIERERAATR